MRGLRRAASLALYLNFVFRFCEMVFQISLLARGPAAYEIVNGEGFVDGGRCV